MAKQVTAVVAQLAWMKWCCILFTFELLLVHAVCNLAASAYASCALSVGS